MIKVQKQYTGNSKAQNLLAVSKPLKTIIY